VAPACRMGDGACCRMSTPSVAARVT